MLQTKINNIPSLVNKMNTVSIFPKTVEDKRSHQLDNLLAGLSPDRAWGDRQIAAQKLGTMRNPEALPGLLDALTTDPFWMVRTAVIQALEMIGDPKAIPTLREIAINDGFQVVRSYAASAIDRLS